jgi:hypothetical protein
MTPLQVLPHEVGDTPRALEPVIDGESSHVHASRALPMSASHSPK